MRSEVVDQRKAVNDAFSKQSLHFEDDDFSNPVLQEWRKRVYVHVDQLIKPNSRILELNAGTGIDASYFAGRGHLVHATDLSNGMIAKLNEKASAFPNKITVQQVSFDELDQVDGKFDFVFSNFGGLNCIEDLTGVTKHLPRLLNEGAFVTWVIMPRICPWEWTWVLKGKFGDAFRRLRKKGTVSHLEGEYFYTYYHSVSKIKYSFGPQFQFIKSEGLGVFSPPPAAQHFAKTFPSLSTFLSQIDRRFSNKYPFKRWGDHVIVTFSFYGKDGKRR